MVRRPPRRHHHRHAPVGPHARRAATSTQGSCTTAGQQITCALGTLASGQSETVTLQATVRALGRGEHHQQHRPAHRRSARSDPRRCHHPAGLHDDRRRRRSRGHPDGRPAERGCRRHRAVHGHRAQRRPAGRDGPIALTDDLPAGLSVQSIVPAQGTCGTGDPFACALGTLASGAQTTVVITARVTVAEGYLQQPRQRHGHAVRPQRLQTTPRPRRRAAARPRICASPRPPTVARPTWATRSPGP